MDEKEIVTLELKHRAGTTLRLEFLAWPETAMLSTRGNQTEHFPICRALVVLEKSLVEPTFRVLIEV